MKTETAHTGDVHTLTLAEIGRLSAATRADRDAVVGKLAALHESRASRMPEVPLSDRDTDVRRLATQRLNEFSPSAWAMPASMPLEQQLHIELDAIDLVLSALSAKELTALAAATYEWEQEHGAAWNDLCAQILLAATRLQALEAKAIKVRESIGAIPATLPLTSFIGNGRSIVGAPWQNDPISRARNEALEKRIISRKDIEDAKNV
jgi:hypothetical protein